MIINFFNNMYFTTDKVLDKLDVEIIITNNCDKFDRIDNIMDMRIFEWLLDNDYNMYKDKPEIKNLKDSNNYIENQKLLINSNKHLIENAFEYTKIHKIINKNHNFQYNKNEWLKLIEQSKQNERLNFKMNKYDVKIDYEKLEELNRIKFGIIYDFINPTGKIMGKGFNIVRFDRKKYINLFKLDNPVYLVDIRNFEPMMLNYYLPDYIHNNFYEDSSKVLGIDRDEFKQKFLAWVNGAGRSRLGNLYDEFKTRFIDVENLRNKLISRQFKNFFGRIIKCNESYKRLGYLIQSTAGDLIKKLHEKLYDINKKFKIIWSLFDEFLIEGDKDQFIEIISQNFKLELKTNLYL